MASKQVWRFASGGDWHRLAPASGNRIANSVGARLFPCGDRAGLRVGSRDQSLAQNRPRPLQTSMPEGARPCRRAGAPRKSQDSGNISVPQFERFRRIAGETDRKSFLRQVHRAVCRHYVVGLSGHYNTAVRVPLPLQLRESEMFDLGSAPSRAALQITGAARSFARSIRRVKIRPMARLLERGM